VETITHYLEKHAGDIIAKKKAAALAGCPLGARLPRSSRQHDSSSYLDEDARRGRSRPVRD
jgi:hypothetical protein